MGELALEAGLPAGVLNIVPGSGEVAGAALAKHAGIDKASSCDPACDVYVHTETCMLCMCPFAKHASIAKASPVLLCAMCRCRCV